MGGLWGWKWKGCCGCTLGLAWAFETHKNPQSLLRHLLQGASHAPHHDDGLNVWNCKQTPVNFSKSCPGWESFHSNRHWLRQVHRKANEHRPPSALRGRIRCSDKAVLDGASLWMTREVTSWDVPELIHCPQKEDSQRGLVSLRSYSGCSVWS